MFLGSRLDSGTILDELFKSTSGDVPNDDDIESTGATASSGAARVAKVTDNCDSDKNNSDLFEPHLVHEDTDQTVTFNGKSDLTSQDIETLRKANETLRSNMTCKICLDEPVQELFLPCRHLVCCSHCAASVRTCPFCRQRIVGTIKAFI